MNNFSLFEKINEKQEYNNNNNILNKNNKKLSQAFIQKILKKYEVNYKILNFGLFQKSFIHKSYTIKDNDEIKESIDYIEIKLQKDSNERLEFLGDSIIGCIITSYLFKRYPCQNEGFMTKLKTNLVNTKALCTFAKILNLGEYLVISNHVEKKCNGRQNDNLLEDLFEAFIGALYIDANNVKLSLDKRNLKKCYISKRSGFGYQICENFLINLIEKEVDFEDLILNDTNYKDKLLKYYHHNFQITPKYKVVKLETTKSNKKLFTIGVLNKKLEIIATGCGNTKKQAEQNASKNALIKLNL